MIYLIFVLFIEVVLNGVMSMTFADLSYMTPLLVVANLNIIYLFSKSDKQFIILSIVIGIFYDILYTHYFFLNFIYFLLIALFIIKYYQDRKVGFLDMLFMSIVLVASYDIYLFLITKALGYTYTFNDLIYKINHTCFFNVIFVFFIIILLKCRIFKKNKRFN